MSVPKDWRQEEGMQHLALDDVLAAGYAVLRWAGIVDDDDKPVASRERTSAFLDALPNSSVPVACEQIADGLPV